MKLSSIFHISLEMPLFTNVLSMEEDSLSSMHLPYFDRQFIEAQMPSMRAKDITFGSLRYQLSPRRRHLNESNKASERIVQGIGTTVRRHLDERGADGTGERCRHARRKDMVSREFQGTKLPFAYTQTTIRLYPNGHSPILKSKCHIFEWTLEYGRCMEDKKVSSIF